MGSVGKWADYAKNNAARPIDHIVSAAKTSGPGPLERDVAKTFASRYGLTGVTDMMNDVEAKNNAIFEKGRRERQEKRIQDLIKSNTTKLEYRIGDFLNSSNDLIRSAKEKKDHVRCEMMKPRTQQVCSELISYARNDALSFTVSLK